MKIESLFAAAAGTHTQLVQLAAHPDVPREIRAEAKQRATQLAASLDEQLERLVRAVGGGQSELAPREVFASWGERILSHPALHASVGATDRSLLCDALAAGRFAAGDHTSFVDRASARYAPTVALVRA